MIRYDTVLLSDYLERLSAREPVPGGGSAAALVGALGAALVSMVVRYSLGKGKTAEIETQLQAILVQAETARRSLLELTSRDSEAYLQMRSAKKSSHEEYLIAAESARSVSLQMAELCRQILGVMDFLRKEANPYLLSDVIAAETFLQAGVKASLAMIESNS